MQANGAKRPRLAFAVKSGKASRVNVFASGESSEEEVQDATLPRPAPSSVSAASEDGLGLLSRAFMSGLQRRWRLGEAARSEEGDLEASAARAAQLFRLKDTVASLYAWGLLPRSTLKDIVEAMRKEVEEPSKMVILDPIAGTGLHSVLLRQVGVKVWCADSVDGGSTQTSVRQAGFPSFPSSRDLAQILVKSESRSPMPVREDTNYLNQCVSTGSAARAAAAAGAAAANAAVSAAGRAVAWTEMDHVDVFDSGEAATAWWQRAEVGCPVLMLSFPPPPPAEVAEAALRRFRGSWLLFIGEWRGCTGGAGFFDLLEAEWQKMRVFSLPQWPMMEDRVYLLRRQPRPSPSVEKSRECPNI
eukprot:s3156_g2.t1